MSKISNWHKEHLRIKNKTTKEIKKSLSSLVKTHHFYKNRTIRSIKKFQNNFITQHLRYKKNTEKKIRKTQKKYNKWFNNNKPKIFLTLATTGMILIAFGSLSIFYRRTILSFKVSPIVVVDVDLRKPQPTMIRFDNLDIQVPIMPAKIEDGIWQTSDTHATHLETSMRPGEGGNIVIYGHNKKDIFAPLKRVGRGQIINLENNKGSSYQYQVTDIQIVTPDQIEVVLPTDHEQLTVYTCTGWFDSLRLVIRALPL